MPSCWATERKHKLITRYATATTNLTAFDRSILEECLSHDLLNLQSSTSFMVGAGLLSPHPATKKVHAFACMCLQEARLPAAESTQTSLFARLGEWWLLQNKRFCLGSVPYQPWLASCTSAAAFRSGGHLLYHSLLLFFEGILQENFFSHSRAQQSEHFCCTPLIFCRQWWPHHTKVAREF